MKTIFAALIILFFLLPSFALTEENKPQESVVLKKSHVFEAVAKLLEIGDRQIMELFNKYMITAPLRERKIENWQQLNSSLKNKNINVDDVDWTAVNEYCTPLEEDSNQYIYNQCRFDRAVIQQTHYGDLTYCKTRTERQFPGELVDKAIDLQKITVLNEDELIEMKTVTIGPFSEVELDRRRSNFYEECMEKRGWNNPYDWKLGKVR